MTEDRHGDQALPPLDTLAARLEYLFDTVRPTPVELGPSDEPGRKYNNKEIADKINAVSTEDGVTISAAYIGELRRGVAGDPRMSHIRALAKAFGVSPGYFVDDAAARRIQDQIGFLVELRRMDVKKVALRQLLADSGLSTNDAVLVEQMVARLRDLPADEVDDGSTDIKGDIGIKGGVGSSDATPAKRP